MPLWAGPLALPAPAQPLSGLCLSAPPASHASSTLIPRRAKLHMLAFIDPSRIPLWMAAGPSLDVYTTEDETEEWFRKVFCGNSGLGEEAEERELDEVRQCGVGVLVGVRSADGGGMGDDTDLESSGGGVGGFVGKGDWAVTELLLYGKVEKREVVVGVTPPRSSPTQGRQQQDKNVGGEEEGEGEDAMAQARSTVLAGSASSTNTIITNITIHALPLTSHHNFSAPLAALRPPSPPPLPLEPGSTTTVNSLCVPKQPQLPLTPTNTSRLNHLQTQKASFLLPNPLDSPQISKSVKKRRADVFSQAVENRKKGRLLSVAPQLPPPPPPVPLQRRQSVSLASLRGQSREPSIARSLMREGTAFSVRDRERDNDRNKHNRDWDYAEGRAGGGDDGFTRPTSRSPSPGRPASHRSRPSTSSTNNMSRPGTSLGMPMIKKEPSIGSFTTNFSTLPKYSHHSENITRPGSSRPTSRASGSISGPTIVKREQKQTTSGGPDAISPPSGATPGTADIQVLSPDDPQAIEARNKDAISRMVMSGMKLYGLKRGGPSTSTGLAEAEEYKLVYHNTLKSAVFALRGVIGVEVLEGRVLGEVVERLLGLFCGGDVGGSGVGARRNPVAEALVEIEGLKGRVKELERGGVGRGGDGGGGGGGVGTKVKSEEEEGDVEVLDPGSWGNIEKEKEKARGRERGREKGKEKEREKTTMRGISVVGGVLRRKG